MEKGNEINLTIEGMPDFAFWNNWSKKSSQFATSLSRECLIIKALLAMESIQEKDRGEDEDEDEDKRYKIQQSTCSCKELLCELRRISRLKASVPEAALRTSNQFGVWRFGEAVSLAQFLLRVRAGCGASELQ